MINKYMIGRLGNQMFQYAAVRAYQINNNLENEELNLDFSNIYKQQGPGFEDSLKYFNVINYSTNKIKLNPIQYLIINFDKFLNLMLFRKDDKKHYKKSAMKIYKRNIKYQSLLNKLGIFNIRFGYVNFNKTKTKNKVFYGTYECPKYFDSIRDTLLKEFTPKEPLKKENEKLYNAIINSESVCITIRRGDYVENKDIAKSLYICTPKYFDKALEEMKKLVPNMKLFVFSDDVEWCKNNMNFPKGTMYESGNDPVYEKLRLMYSCKHFILSNSTFSWWAEYLSTNKNKKVIAPSRWTNDPYKEGKMDIYEDYWTLIDVDSFKVIDKENEK